MGSFEVCSLISKYLGIFSRQLIVFISHLVPLWSEDTFCVSVLYNGWQLVSWSSMWSVLVNISRALILQLLSEYSVHSIRSRWLRAFIFVLISFVYSFFLLLRMRF